MKNKELEQLGKIAAEASDDRCDWLNETMEFRIHWKKVAFAVAREVLRRQVRRKRK